MTILKNNKFIIIGDIHLGIRKDCAWTYRYQLESLKKITQYAKDNNITTIVQTGDFFDTRRAITHLLLMRFRTEIMPLFDELNLIVLVGNHDIFYRESILPNAPQEMFHSYKNVQVINDPTTIKINDQINFDIIPWICNDNRDTVMEFIDKSKSKYCAGHFELSGYFYYKGLKSNGSSNGFLDKYKQVYSGHYHTISEGDNVLYVGTPYTLTAGDANDPRGFWVVDIDKKNELLTHEFVENDVMNHKTINFDADTYVITDADDLAYKNTNVIVNVLNRDSVKQKITSHSLEEYLIRLPVHGLKIIDTINYDGVTMANVTSGDITVKDNTDLAYEYLEQLNLTDDQHTLTKAIFDDLYIQSVKIKNNGDN